MEAQRRQLDKVEREGFLEEGVSEPRNESTHEPAEGVGREFQEARPACAKVLGKHEGDLGAESKTEHIQRGD